MMSVESCHEPHSGCGTWVANYANLWRTVGDVQNTWSSIMSNIHKNNEMAEVARVGHYNDAEL